LQIILLEVDPVMPLALQRSAAMTDEPAPSESAAGRDQDLVAAISDAPVSRDEILSRYRQLRAFRRRHHAEALNFSPRQTVLDYARRLGLAVGKTLVAENIDQLALVFDLAIYSSKERRSRAIDRYRNAMRAPPGSDDARMLDAMGERALLGVARRAPA
jgi:hypothetical protein